MFDLETSFLAHVRLILVALLSARTLARQVPAWSALGSGLGGIEEESSILHPPPSTCGKLKIRIQCGGPSGQEAVLDLTVLGESRLTHLLFGQSIFLEGCRKRVIAASSV